MPILVDTSPLTTAVRVEVAFDSGYGTAASARSWTDLTGYWEAQNDLSISRGRNDNESSVGPSSLSNLVLNNTDGRFTPELTSGAYYPNVKKGRPIRVRLRYPTAMPCNFLTVSAASMEAGVGDWSSPTAFGTLDVATLSSSTLHPQDGTKGGLATWPTTAIGSAALTPVTGLVIGRTYTASCYVFVPVGSPNVWMDATFVAAGTPTATKGALALISVTFVATQATQFIGPRCASATVGQQCFWDSVMIDEGSTVAAFTTTAPSFSDRFTGYVDEWAVQWPSGSDLYSTCTVSATSRSARLSNASALRSIIEEEYAVDTPALQFTLSEDAGATSAGNSSTTPQNPLTIAQAGVGGTVTFGSGTGPGTDSLTAVQLAAASPGNGQYLTAQLISQLTGPFDSDLTLDIFFLTSSATAQTLVALVADSNNFLHLGIDATGKLAATIKAVDNTGTVRTATATSAGSVANGATHYGALRVALNDGTGQATVSVVTDLAVVTAAAVAWPAYVGTTFFPAFMTLYVGGPAVSTVGGVFTGTLAHVGAYVQADVAITDARLQAHSNAGLTGFSGETAQARIARYASYLGVPTAEQSLETGLLTGVPHVDTTDAAGFELMQRVAITSEDGLLFDGRDGSLVFQSRSHRYNVAAAVTLDASVQEVGADFAPKLNDQDLANDITASRPGGITVRSTNAASIAEYGYYRNSTEILTTSDVEVQAAADWRVSRRGLPRAKAPTLTVDLLTFPPGPKVTAILSLELGAKVTATNLPPQAQASSLDMFIEGATETIGISSWGIGWNTSPANLSNVWQLDSGTYSQLDSTTVLAY